MIRDLARFQHRQFDLLIVGGGINGAAIAHLAAAAGASVALLEKGDFASGTSSKSTKLLHGGIRYLENFEFDLVHESLHERYIQWQAVPYLAKALAFVVPVYKNDKRPLWMMQLGVWLYDLLSGSHRIGQHRKLSVDEILQLAPGINTKDLTGGVEYYDVQMDDARICLENVLMADTKGAVVANYLEVKDFIKYNQQAVGVTAQDRLTGQQFEVKAKQVVVTAGPWSDELISKDIPNGIKRLRPTKGVHIIYRGEISKSAFLLQSRQDKRIFFVIPFKGNSLIGTTDTDYTQDPDKVNTDEADIQYLLQEAGRVFPNITFDRSKIISTFAGVRPLVADRGNPSQISRKHVLEKNPSGIYFVMGGKYTTYRAIAEEAVRKILPSFAQQIPYGGQFELYGSSGVNDEVKILSQRYEVSIDLIKYLQGIYGSRFADVLNISQKNPILKEKICSCSPAIAAQLVYAKDIEMAIYPQDIIERRLELAYLDCPTRACRHRIEEILK